MKKFIIQERITQRDGESLDFYLKELNSSKYDPISSEEESKLAKLMINGDQKAKNKLINANLRFGVSVAKSYQGNGIPLSDLINEASIGMIKAAGKFDETRGFKFISYAVWWIRQTILKSIADNGKVIRLPMNQHNQLNKINKAKAELEQKFGRRANTSEIAEYLTLSSSDVTLVTDFISKPKSFSDPLGDDDSTTIGNTISGNMNADDNLMEDSLTTTINDALSQFSDRDVKIVKMSFGIGRDYPVDDDEIAEMYNITRERVRQIKKKVAKTLSKNDTLRSFMG